MTWCPCDYRDRQRLADIQAAIDAIRSHRQRGDLSDGLVFDAVRIRLLEIGEAVKVLPAGLLGTQPGLPWRQIARMRDHLAHRYFDTAHSILQGAIDDDLPELKRAIHVLAQTLPDEDHPDEGAQGRTCPAKIRTVNNRHRIRHLGPDVRVHTHMPMIVSHH